MNRTVTLIAAIALLSTMQAGCDGANRTGATRPAPAVARKADPPKDSPRVTVTAGARTKLKKLSAAGKTSWQITYNGTCAGAPSLGIYPPFADIPPGVTVEEIDGVEFILDDEVTDLVPRWGPVIIRCLHPGSSDLAAEFAPKDGFQQP